VIEPLGKAVAHRSAGRCRPEPATRVLKTGQSLFSTPSARSALASPDRFSRASAVLAAASFALVIFTISDNQPSGNRTRHIRHHTANSVPPWRTTQAMPCEFYQRRR
jgi:hypothetical protein